MRLILYLLLAKAVLWIAASFWPGSEPEPAFIGAAAPPAAARPAVPAGDSAVAVRYAPGERIAQDGTSGGAAWRGLDRGA
jgi:hypothetical protein